MTRVVVDTNVFVSAFMFGGLPGEFLDLLLFGNLLQLVTSPALLTDLEEKLRTKFRISDEDAKMIHRKLEGLGEVITPATVLQFVADDPDDDRVLECAVDGCADFVVSGDRHLLRIGSFKSIPIVTVRQFLSLHGLSR